MLMIKKIAWETFKNTGDINAFIELKQIENIEKEIEEDGIEALKGKTYHNNDSLDYGKNNNKIR